MAAAFLNAEISSLLTAVGQPNVPFEVAPVATGGNNRVVSVIAAGQRYIAKWYYHDAAQTRDRLQSEFFFLQHAWRQGIRCIPQPLASDPAARVALYELVEGQHLRPEQLDAHKVRQAARFFAALNTESSRSAGRHLASASDACFSVAEHVSSVDRRIAKLSSIPADTPADREGAMFAGELAAGWAAARQRVLLETEDPQAVIPDRWRCLSPSDFGFHNALLRPSGEICFLDFEYAGWDDPAKMIGDFFAHPGLPVALELFDAYAADACAPFADAGILAERARRLEVIARVRWCCIILNEFLPDIARRRRFADPALDLEARKLQQVRKARQLYATPAA
jgi:hypothetical protein